jgi:hypothetical protein
MSLLINVSNHPSSCWSEEQKAGWSQIWDYPHPSVPATATSEEVAAIARKMFNKIVLDLYVAYRVQSHVRGRVCNEPLKNNVIIKKLLSTATFHVAGEWSFFFHLVSLIRASGGCCIAACSERQTVESVLADGSTCKNTVFQFRQWRALCSIQGHICPWADV